ncbi:DUF2971 domain-containing protein [Adhaeretor mobilis]|uniref:DUF2971 domain-containing protein n=1 Tax=Adhaeretor mobilis TaxID=1930276 RepID=A0A517N296_9BACT|nr:DUF2971 domain-containing protein [Adhaeretor mobilis]QDT01257.1 hypothetical protein HG15A2_45990 [Adhaeretor mobilis]
MKQLYKYTRINNNTSSALIEGYAWYPKPSSLNDPFDCGLSQSLMGSNNQWGVLSLSAISANIMMWSHYADSHKGVCIEYTDYTDDQLSELPLKSNINPYDEEYDELPIIRNASPIEYLSTAGLNDQLKQLPQSLDEFNSELKKYNTGPPTQEKYENGFVIRGMKALFMKHEDWSYEKEYRIVTQEGNKPISAPGVVTTIFLGMNTSEIQCQHIYRIGTEIGTKVLKMERVASAYELRPRELTKTEMKRPKLDFSRPINNFLRKIENQV